jgi:hypothetical protein
MNVTKGLQAERLIAKRFEERGYLVQIDPPPVAIPFSLGGYRPDILAEKAGEHIIIEVKTAGVPVDTDFYVELDERVQQHPGWKFLLVTVSDLELENEGASGSLVPADEIETSLARIDRLLESDEAAGLAFPLLWTAMVAALRLLLAKEGLEFARNGDLAALNKAYAEGVLSFEAYEEARRFMAIRNRAVHSMGVVAEQEDCKKLRQLVGDMLERLAAAAGA